MTTDSDATPEVIARDEGARAARPSRVPGPIVPPRSASDAQPIDWNWVRAQAIAHLQRLIQIDTSNPPGNELPVARYLGEVLGRAGIETRVVEPTAGRGAVIARLRGSGAARPVLLLAHMDVVGVEPTHWSVAPFSGAIEQGCLYGRGAIDDKGMLVTNLQGMLLLKQEVLDRGGALARDLVFVATSDEEQAGEWGIDWLLDHAPELRQAEFALNEGGRIRVVGGKVLYAAVQCAEKVPHNLRLTAQGPPGHAAVPLPENAVVRLARAVAAVGEHREPVRVSAITRAFFGGLATVWPDARERRAMRDVAAVDDDARVRRGARVLERTPVFNAVLRTGISPTIIEGGIRRNVIPTDASAVCNVRTLPGESLADVVRRLEMIIDDERVSIEVLSSAPSAPPSPPDSAMFDAIGEALRALVPGIAVVPYLSTGATDSAKLRAHGVQAYGLLPFPLEQVDEERMHGNDERVPLDSLEFGVRLTYDLLRRVAAAGAGGADRATGD